MCDREIFLSLEKQIIERENEMILQKAREFAEVVAEVDDFKSTLSKKQIEFFEKEFHTANLMISMFKKIRKR